MREFKFRAWDDFHKRFTQYMIESYDNGKAKIFFKKTSNNYSDWEISENKNRFKLSQYTELKNNNGAKIYEGDICSFVIFDYLDNDTAYTSNVIFQQGSFGFIIKNYQNEECFYELSYILSQDDEVEVIGNIYENPELLSEI